MENYDYELKERYQQLKNDFFIPTKHFMGGKGLADDMMFRLIDEEAFSLESFFLSFQHYIRTRSTRLRMVEFIRTRNILLT